jgi:hypothetical protein
MHVQQMARVIQIRNVPESLHRTPRTQAELAGMSLSDYLLAVARRLAERPTVDQLRQRLHRHPIATGTASAEEAVRQGRDAR